MSNFQRPYLTKSYYYIPTHFLYSSLLFFLLIFMYQLIRCHALIQPFSKIFFFRIYVPTTQTHPRHIDFISDETSVRFPQIHAPTSSHYKLIHNNTVHQISAPTQPHKPIHQTTTSINSTPAPTNAHRASAHKHTHCDADTHATQAHRRR